MGRLKDFFVRKATTARKSRYYDNEFYEPALHYMRGRPGPACRAAKRSSLPQPQNGSDSRLVVASSDLTRVSPDPLSALLRRS